LKPAEKLAEKNVKLQNMPLRRKCFLVLALGLFLVGLWVFVYDVWFICRYGFDYNDVLSVINEGPIDYPTGERPNWTIIPLFAYSLLFWLPALAILIFRPNPPHRGRIRFGAE
jgi:4-amino-4-deoxy-L-arabinose transferase-like glycosyltransferase